MSESSLDSRPTECVAWNRVRVLPSKRKYVSSEVYTTISLQRLSSLTNSLYDIYIVRMATNIASACIVLSCFVRLPQQRCSENSTCSQHSPRCHCRGYIITRQMLVGLLSEFRLPKESLYMSLYCEVQLLFYFLFAFIILNLTHTFVLLFTFLLFTFSNRGISDYLWGWCMWKA